MNAIIAQAAALAAHARVRRLDARLGGDESYWQRHSTFQYVRTLRFSARRRRVLWLPDAGVATTVPKWMAALPRDADILFLSRDASTNPAAHLASAFVGGTREAIAVQTSDRAARWTPSWKTTARYPETKIWAVRYVEKPCRAPIRFSGALDDARRNLAAALGQVADLVEGEAGLSNWREVFAKAEAQLEASTPVAPYHPDILPAEGYSLPARQLLAAAVSAFVFGGMGSWNDVWFENRERRALYERLTQRLYVTVMDGLTASVNSGA